MISYFSDHKTCSCNSKPSKNGETCEARVGLGRPICVEEGLLTAELPDFVFKCASHSTVCYLSFNYNINSKQNCVFVCLNQVCLLVIGNGFK
jgi:hypothetical protein